MAFVRLGVASFFWLLLCVSSTLALASPALPQSAYTPRSFTVSNTTGTPQVFDGNGNTVSQGDATDGSGSNFDLPALIWLGFSVVIGLPMALAGIRGWRLTTGTGLGLASAVCVWAGIINTVNGSGFGDILLTAVILIIFAVGFALGLLEVARLGAITAIALAGGLSFGMRIILIRQGLLFSSNLFVLNWVVVGLCGIFSGLSLLLNQRYGLLFGCTSIGTFFTGLAVDLVLERQSGMSLGLRLLFDSNDSHAVFFLTTPYLAPLRTKIVIIASLGLIPFLALAQHRLFPRPFTRRPDISDEALQINYPTEFEAKRTTYLVSLWDGARERQGSAHRFSV